MNKLCGRKRYTEYQELSSYQGWRQIWHNDNSRFSVYGGSDTKFSVTITWWRHKMETFPRYWPFVRKIHVADTGGFPSQRPVARRFDVFFDVRLDKQLSKQSKCRWFETPLWSLWYYCHDLHGIDWYLWWLIFQILSTSAATLSNNAPDSLALCGKSPFTGGFRYKSFNNAENPTAEA